jgi:hypothetical protein
VVPTCFNAVVGYHDSIAHVHVLWLQLNAIRKSRALNALMFDHSFVHHDPSIEGIIEALEADILLTGTWYNYSKWVYVTDNLDSPIPTS